MVDRKISVANANEGTGPSVFAQCMDKVNNIRDNIVEIVQKIDTKSTESPTFKDIQSNYVSVQNQIKECKSVYDQYKELSISYSEIKDQFANRIFSISNSFSDVCFKYGEFIDDVKTRENRFLRSAYIVNR
ncbi:hypothetical protein NOVO_03580 [Rickettsiales bacterium Ac37b]|nr:hypothetical protein NOVO_03580 [Rickettsiales bacterium Ac37b]